MGRGAAAAAAWATAAPAGPGGVGGFNGGGGSAGTSGCNDRQSGYGGGGGAMGGALFAMKGTTTLVNVSFSGSSVTAGVKGGTGASNGTTAGTDVFICTAAQSSSCSAVVNACIRWSVPHGPCSQHSFSGIVCRHVLWTLPDLTAVLQTWTHLLQPGAKVLLVEGFWHTGCGPSCGRTIGSIPITVAKRFRLRFKRAG